MFAAFAVPCVGFALHYWQAGWAAMSEELEVWWVYVLQATGIVFLTLFLWNLACAPYRIERAARMAFEAENADLKSKISSAKRNLTAAQKTMISDLVRGRLPSDQFVMLWTFQSEECIDLAEDFKTAFLQGGSKAEVRTNMIGGPLPAAYRDLSLVRYPNGDREIYNELSELLTEFGIKHKITHSGGCGHAESIRILVSRPS